MVKMSTADRLAAAREARKRQGLSYASVAEACGVDELRVYRALTGITQKVDGLLLDAMEAALAIGTAPQPYPLPEGGVAEEGAGVPAASAVEVAERLAAEAVAHLRGEFEDWVQRIGPGLRRRFEAELGVPEVDSEADGLDAATGRG